MSVTKKFFGKTPDGRDAYLYTMANASGACAAVTDYGAHLVSVCVPDRRGVLADVCLGFDSAESYAVEGGSLGATVGRFANRIAKGRFSLNGETYSLFINNGPNTLHGGKEGFDKRLFDAKTREGENEDTVTFSYVSPDMEEGFPGEMKLSVTFAWNSENTLSIRYSAVSDRDTVINLTNHAYFNLAGKGDILGHTLQVNADCITDVDDELIPTGDYLPVDGTPLDLRAPARIGAGVDRRAECHLIDGVNGYDMNFVLKGQGLKEAAILRDEASGREMKVFTTEPGIQVYTGQGLNTEGHGGAHYGPFAGVALETQHFPDSPNKPQFPTTTLKAGETYESTTVYAFSAK